MTGGALLLGAATAAVAVLVVARWPPEQVRRDRSAGRRRTTPSTQVQAASVYARGRRVYICAQYRADPSGIWFQMAPFAVADLDAPDLAATVLEVLGASYSPIPHPGRDAQTLPGLYELAGVTTWGAFARGAKLVHLKAEDGSITLTPMHNGGGRHGFDGSLAHLAVTIPRDEGELASALPEAISRCRP